MKTPIYSGIFQSDLDATGYRIIGLPMPSAGNEAATKAYVDAHSGGGGVGTVVSDGSHQVTATELLTSLAGTRTPIASLAPNGGNYFDSQAFDPCIVVNPTDSTQLIMLFTGMAAPVGTGNQTIGRATASIYNPATWTVSNSPVLTPTLAWEIGFGLRADSLVYNPSDGKLYLFYTGSTGSTSSVGVASSSDLGLTWTKLGQVLTPTAPETYVSQFSVLLEGSTLHGLYSYRTASLTLPAWRYASASSSNWLSWTKGGVDVYSDAGRFMEFHQLFKVGNTYITCYESGTGSTPFDLRFATSSSPSSGWTIGPVVPFLAKSALAGTFDQYHTATGHAMVINGYWYIIYCGALDHDQPYYTNHWQMGIVPLLTSQQVSSLYIGTDLRLIPISGGGKLQARNPSTNTWADRDQWTNP